jgi:hypothetical protein
MAADPFAGLFSSPTSTTTSTSQPSSSSSDDPFANLFGPPASTPATSNPNPVQGNNGPITTPGNQIKVTTIPSWLGRGYYNIDSSDPGKIINTGHSDYGGVPETPGYERGDIIPVSLGGDNAAPNGGNIVLQPLLPKDQQKPGVLTSADAQLDDPGAVSDEEKDGIIDLGAARQDILTFQNTDKGGVAADPVAHQQAIDRTNYGEQVDQQYKAGKITLQQARQMITDFATKQPQQENAKQSVGGFKGLVKFIFSKDTYSPSNIKQTFGIGPKQAPESDAQLLQGFQSQGNTPNKPGFVGPEINKSKISQATPDQLPTFEKGTTDPVTGEMTAPKFNINPKNNGLINGAEAGLNDIISAPTNFANKFGDFATMTFGNNSTPSQKVAGVAQGITAATSVIPAWVTFNASLDAAQQSRIPGVSQLAGYTQGLFKGLATVSGKLGTAAVTHAPISDQAKSNLVSPISDLFSNVIPLLAFHAVGVGTDKITGTEGSVDSNPDNLAGVVNPDTGKIEGITPSKPGLIDQLPLSDNAKGNLKTGIRVGVGAAMNPLGTIFDYTKAISIGIYNGYKERQASGIPITPDEANKIASEVVKTTPSEEPIPATLKVTTASGRDINIDTQQGLVLKNLIKGQEDLSYKRVASLPKDSNGNQIDARFEWDYNNQKGTIIYDKNTPIGSLVHEFGHYMDRNLSDEVGTKLSDLLPDYNKNKESINASLAGYAANQLQIEGKENITPEDLNAKIMDLADKFHKQVYSLTGSSIPETREIAPTGEKVLDKETQNSISTKQSQLDKEWDRIQEAKNNTDNKTSIKQYEKAQKAIEEQMKETQNSIMYHGSNVDDLDTIKSKNKVFYKDPFTGESTKSTNYAAFFTEDKSQADKFAKDRTDYFGEGKPTTYSKDIDIDNMKIADLRDPKSAEKVFKELNLSPPDVFHTDAKTWSSFFKGGYETVNGKSHTNDEKLQSIYKQFQDKDFVSALKAKGYDGATFNETPFKKSMQTYALFKDVDLKDNSVSNKEKGNTAEIVQEARKDFGEKFATAVRNILVNPEESSKIAPELTSFITHQSNFMGWMSDRLSHTQIDSQFVGKSDINPITPSNEAQPRVTQESEKVIGNPETASPMNVKKSEDIASPKGKSITTKAFNEGKINTSDDVIRTMNEIAEQTNQFADVRRTTTLEEQKDFSRRFLGSEDLYKTLPQDMKDNTGKMLAAQQMMTDLATDLTQQLKVTNSTDTEGMKEISDKYLRLMATMKAFAGARSAAGQALGALRNETMSGENSVALADLHQTLLDAGLGDKAKALNLEQTMKIVKKVSEPTIIDNFWQLWYANNIMLNPSTYVKHLGGNLVNLAFTLSGAAVRNPNEFLGAFPQYVNGWLEAAKNTSWNLGPAPKDEVAAAHYIKEAPDQHNIFGDSKFTKIVSYPGKILNNLNSIFYYGHAAAESYGIARDQAIEEKKANPSVDIPTRTQEIMNNLNPDQQKDVDQFARKGTFTQQLGSDTTVHSQFISMIAGLMTRVTSATHAENENAVNMVKSWLGKEDPENVNVKKGTIGLLKIPFKLINPVIRTGANVLSEGLDLTPLALLDGGLMGNVVKSVKESVKNQAYENYITRKQEQQVTKAFVGTIALTALAKYALAGNISGQGPVGNYTKLAALKLNGWQPASIKVGNKWYSYQSLGPLSAPLAILGNYNDQSEYNGMANDSLHARLTASLLASAQTISDEGFFTGVQGLLDAVNSGGSKAATYFSNEANFLLSSLAPGAPTANAIHKLFDNTTYQVPGDIKAYILKMYGYTKGLKPSLNAFGEPISGTSSTALNIKDSASDPVAKYLGDNNIVVNAPSKTTKITDSNGNKNPMTPDQYYTYLQQSGTQGKSAILDEINDPNSDLNEATNSVAKQKVINSIERQVRAQVLLDMENGN